MNLEISSTKEIYKKLKRLKPGDIFWGDLGYKCHVLTNLPKEEQIVFKYFGKNKKWWHYGIESYFWFELRMTVVKDEKTIGGRKPMNFRIKQRRK